MKRRQAIKNLSLSIGYLVSAPAVSAILESCAKSEPGWTAVFLNEELKPLVSHLVDIILPSSDSPGGLDLDLPQFVDKMCADILTKEDQEWFTQGGLLFSEHVARHTDGNGSQASPQDVLDIFKTYFDLSPEKKKVVLERQQMDEEKMSHGDKESFSIYRFLLTIREFALLGYFTSERIGKDYLVFDPIPGGYKPCIPLSDVGNAWTIG